MDESVELIRYQWSRLSSLTLGRYAEHWATLRFIECGLEVYSSEVDDRAIDCLVRFAPGRCLEVKVKAIRNRNLTFVEKWVYSAGLGATPHCFSTAPSGRAECAAMSRVTTQIVSFHPAAASQVMQMDGTIGVHTRILDPIRTDEEISALAKFTVENQRIIVPK